MIDHVIVTVVDTAILVLSWWLYRKHLFFLFATEKERQRIDKYGWVQHAKDRIRFTNLVLGIYAFSIAMDILKEWT